MAKCFMGKEYAFCRVSLVVLLVSALVLGSIPLDLFHDSPITGIPKAEAATDSKDTTSTGSESQATTKEKSQDKEIIEKRSEKAKVFNEGNGHYKMKLFAAPVHYKDKENGAWKDIDPTIKQSNSGDFENTGNSFKTRFGASGKSTNLTSFEYNGMSASFAIDELEANDVAPRIDGSKITYENILPDTDLREIVTGIGIKEDIILKSYTGKNTFSFEMKTTGVDVIKEQDGSIGFYNKGSREKVFSIPKPFMVDSDIEQGSDEGTRCDTVTIDAVQKGSKTFITIAADADWLKSPHRIFPIYVDPTVLLEADNTYVGDTYVSSIQPDTVLNYSNYNNTYSVYPIKCGFKDNTTGENYAFVKFDVATPLYGKKITSATLLLYCYYSNTQPSPTGVWLDLVDRFWDPWQLTWNNWNADARRHYRDYTTVAMGAFAGFNITNEVADWARGSGATTNNFGFRLYETGGQSSDLWKGFAASETGGAHMPYIDVDYEDPVVTPPTIQGTASGNVVNSGSGYVNLSWDPIAGATGYKVWMWNGSYYEIVDDVQGFTEWTTGGRGIWPTQDEIAAGRYWLHINDDGFGGGLGDDLADDPRPVYRNAHNYTDSLGYTFCISAYNSFSETQKSAPFTITIPDRTGPDINIVAPINNSILTVNTPQLSYSVSDDRSGVASQTILLDDSPINKPSGSTLDPLIEGLHTLAIEATDTIGNENMEQVDFLVDIAPPTTPTALSVIADSTGNNLSWRASNDAAGDAGYYIYRATTTGGPYTQLNSMPTTSTTYTDAAVMNGTIYYYVVRAKDQASHMSGYSHEASARFTTDTKPPIAPMNLIATASSATLVNLSWSPSVDNVEVAGYKIERSLDGVSWAQIGTSPASPVGNSFADTGILTGTTYYYRVRAYDSTGNNSTYSNIVQVTTPVRIRYEDNTSLVTKAGTGWALTDNSNCSGGTYISSPVSGDAVAVTFNGTSIKWIGSRGLDRGIAKVYIDNEYQEDVDQYGSLTWQDAVYSKSGLASGQHTLRIVVTGNKNSGSSGPTIDVDAFDIDIPDTQTPTAPTNLRAIEIKPTQIDLSWNPSTDNLGLAGYKVERSTDGSNYMLLGTTVSNTYSDTTVAVGVKYFYRIKAIDKSSNVSDNSSTVSVTAFSTIRYEETTAFNTFTGSWTNGQYVTYSSGAYKYSSTPGSFATITFTGTGIAWITAPGTNKGIAKVYIDNEYQQDVDLYRSTTQYQQVAYSKNDLTYGTHTLKVEVTGTKNVSSTASWIMIDAYDVMGPDTSPTVPANLSVTLASPNQVNLSWSTSSDNLSVIGYKVERSTDGSSFTQVQTVTNNSYIDYYVTANAKYYYRVRAYDNAGNNSDYSAVVSTDTPKVARYESDFSVIIKAGTGWTTGNNSNYSGGWYNYSSTVGDSATFTFTGSNITLIAAPGANRGIAKVTLDGAQQNVDLYSSTTQYQQAVYTKTGLSDGSHTIKVEVTGTKNASSTSTLINIDAFDIADNQAPAVPTDVTATATGPTQVYLTWSPSADDVAVYSYKIEKSTDGINYASYASSERTYFRDNSVVAGQRYYYKIRAYDKAGNISDYSVIASAITPNAVRYEENNSLVIKSGTWGIVSNLSCSKEACVQSSDTVASATLTFTGSNISWIATKGTTYGIAKVTLDGAQQNVDLYSSTTQYQQAVYTKTGLSDGSHTIKVEVTGTKNASSTSTLINIDAFDIADNQAPVITASPAGGKYSTIQSVSLLTSKFASIYYTTDGTTPTISSNQYTGLPISIGDTTTLKFVGVNPAGNASPIYTERYIVDVLPPTLNIATSADSSTVTGDITITVSGADNRLVNKLSLRVSKYGTTDTIDLGEQTGTGTNFNASYALDTAKLTDGEYILTATGNDDVNQSSCQLNIIVQNNKEKLGYGHWGMEENRYGKVNIANGNFLISQEDINLPCLGLGTNVTRIYNSLSGTNGPLGWGWRFDIPELSQYSDGSVIITDADGAKLRYTKKVDGSYARPAGSYEQLTKNTDNTFTWKLKDGTKYSFDDASKKIVEQDKNGNTVTYQYDTAGRLISITDPINRVTTLTYNSTTGKLESVKDYANRTWSYAYDASSNLASVTNPLSYNKTFSYAGHKLASITNEESRTASFSYTGDKLTSVHESPDATTTYTTTYNYPSTSQFTKTDPNGNSSWYAYDANWNILASVDASGNASYFTYDADYNALTKMDTRGNTTTYTYDTNGNLTIERDPLGDTTSYTYDKENNMLSKTNSREYKTTYVYDSEGNTVKEIDALNKSASYTYDNFGNMLSETDVLGRKTTYVYDAAGNKISEKDPQGHTTRYAYDVMGNKVGETDANGAITSYEYDVIGNLISETDPEDDVATYEYNKVGDKVKGIDANGHLTTCTYDWLSRLIAVTDALNNTTTIAYDAVGNKTRDTDAAGKSTSYTYDALGRMLTATVVASNAATATTSYIYDESGNRLNVKDAKGYITSWEYDAANRVVKLTEPGNRVITTTYDKNGNVVDTVDSDSRTATNVYDELDRLVEVRYPDNKTVQYTYDAKGNKKTMVDWHGTTTYEYDACDELIIEARPSSTITYTYDPVHMITGRLLSGKSLKYNYDGAGSLTSIVDTSTNTHIVDLAYDANKNCTSRQYANSTKVKNSYDEVDRATVIENIGASGQTFASFSYTYYVNDLIRTVTDNSGTITYQYDGENKLKIIASANSTTSYTYDSVGNRTATTDTINGLDSVTRYIYEPGTSELTQVIKPNGQTINYLYNENGNVSARLHSDEATETYEYNPNNQLIKVTKSNGDTVLFTYDGDGKRVSKIVNGVTVGYVYDDDLLASEVDASGTALATYVYDDQGCPVSVTKSNQTYYFHYNAQGDVVALTDSAGISIATYTYDVWGNIINKTGIVDTPFTYRGKYGYKYDKETGFYFLSSRYYDPEVGRFTSKDSFQGFASRPASQNPYTYCENDPINYVDPLGFKGWSYGNHYFWSDRMSFDIPYVFDGYGSYLEALRHMWKEKHKKGKKTVTKWYFQRGWDLYITKGLVVGIGIGRIAKWLTDKLHVLLGSDFPDGSVMDKISRAIEEDLSSKTLDKLLKQKRWIRKSLEAPIFHHLFKESVRDVTELDIDNPLDWLKSI